MTSMTLDTPKTGEDGKLPYNADIVLFDKILNDLRTTSGQGVNLGTLWANIGNHANAGRSYTLSLVKYLGLVDHDSTRVWLTELGTTLKYMAKDDKNRKLAQKLPEKYLTMFKWILDQKEVSSNNLKRQFIEIWGPVVSPALLNRSITTFLHYCKWLEIITYSGRGAQAKAVITRFGENVLDTPTIEESSSNKNKTIPDSTSSSLAPNLDEAATYPIIIKTNDRNFDWDIKSGSDWAVVNSVIASIKVGWEKLQGSQTQPTEAGDG